MGLLYSIEKKRNVCFVVFMGLDDERPIVLSCPYAKLFFILEENRNNGGAKIRRRRRHFFFCLRLFKNEISIRCFVGIDFFLLGEFHWLTYMSGGVGEGWRKLKSLETCVISHATLWK